MTVGRKRSESVSLTPYEHNVDVAPVDFPRESSVIPQNEDQPMNPDDVQASEEVGDEEAILAKALPSPTQRTRKEIQEHVLTHLPPRSWCRHCLRGRGTSHPHFRSKTEGGACCADCVNRLLLHGSIWTRGSTRCAPNVGSEISSHG